MVLPCGIVTLCIYEIREMAKVFNTVAPLTRFVKASPPQPAGTEYRVAIGTEKWGDGKEHEVLKVQMVYDGKIAGRTSPSYPLGTDDEQRVREAIDELKALYGPRR